MELSEIEALLDTGNLNEDEKKQFEALVKNLKAKAVDKHPVINNGGKRFIKVISKSNSLNDVAKRTIAQEANQARSEGDLADSIKFNISVKQFAEENKKFLPDEALKIIEIADKTKYSSDTAKANDIRASILKAYIEKERFIKGLPQPTLDKIAKFKELASDEQVKRSGEFWEIILLGIHEATGRELAQSKNKVFANTDSYANKWAEAGKIFNKTKGN